VPDAPAPDCAPGEARCVGAALQLCKESRTGFRTVQLCTSSALCRASGTIGCLPPDCLPGEYDCAGQQLRMCNAQGTGWTVLANCAGAAYCNASLGRCTDAPCNPDLGDTQCNGSLLQECGGSSWQPINECDSGALCNAATAQCEPTGCVVDSEVVPFRCENADFLRCRADKTGFEHLETCLNAGNCNSFIRGAEQLPDTQFTPEVLAQLGCREPRCTPGRWSCDGSTLARCDANRIVYQADMQTCASPGRCDAQLGTCSATPCVDGNTQCSGRDHQTCENDRWRTIETCSRASLCDHEDGCQTEPPVCEVTDYQCNGPLLERCNINGTGWIPVQTCATAALCSGAAKRCAPPLCEPGQRRCDGSGTLQECNSGRDGWNDISPCRELVADVDLRYVSGLCDVTAGCLPQPACVAGSFRCNAQFLERCQDNVWFPYARCEAAGLCDANAGLCAPPQCDQGAYRCISPGAEPVVAGPGDPTRGLTLQVCNDARTAFETVRDCPEDQPCDASRGQCDLCDPLEFLCSQDLLYLCSADGQELEFERQCPSGCGQVGNRAGCLCAPGELLCDRSPGQLASAPTSVFRCTESQDHELEQECPSGCEVVEGVARCIPAANN
jgi:hypothetical protein